MLLHNELKTESLKSKKSVTLLKFSARPDQGNPLFGGDYVHKALQQ